MGDLINYMIDSFLAVLMRLFEFPVTFLLIGLLVFILLVNFIYHKFKKQKPTWNYKLILFFLFFASILIVDKKIANFRDEVNVINEKFHNQLLNNNLRNIDQSKFVNEQKILEVFPTETIVHSQKINPANQLIVLSKNSEPLAKAYIAVIDLTYPTLEIQLSRDLSKKTYTSDFGKEYNCIVAINGEAGETMSMTAPLGEWTGNFIIKGKPYLLEDSPIRPFLSFTENNKATYFEEIIVDTLVNDLKYNTIWGRFDILLKGEIVEQKKVRPYPRTIMGINKEGNILYLMVVDGKRPNYSRGLSLQECAKTLKSIGAYDVMSCDQGGSSCMYIKEVNGLISRPADSEGVERPIYTHFGVSIK